MTRRLLCTKEIFNIELFVKNKLTFDETHSMMFQGPSSSSWLHSIILCILSRRHALRLDSSRIDRVISDVIHTSCLLIMLLLFEKKSYTNGPKFYSLHIHTCENMRLLWLFCYEHFFFVFNFERTKRDIYRRRCGNVIISR